VNPFAPGPPIPMPPHLQQQFVQAIARNEQHMHDRAQAQAQAQVHVQAQNQGQNTPPNTEGVVGTPTGEDAHVGPRPPVSAGPIQPPNTTRTIRQEGIGPNGERWTVTWNNTNLTIPINANQQPILPRPFPHPPGFALPGQRAPSPSGNLPEQVLARTRVAMDYARQEMNNVRALLQPAGGQIAALSALAAANPPPWRVDQIRHAVGNLIGGLDNVDRGLASLVADPLMAQNRDFVSLQQSATELRSEAVDFARILDRLRESSANGSSTTAATPSTSRTVTNTAAPTQTQTPSEFPPELFILSSPQGPVGVLFDQRGTYTTAPMIPTLPFQSFNQQFAANRQLIAGIGQQIARNSMQIPNAQGAPQPAQAQQPPAAGAQPVAEQPHNQPPNQGQNQNQNQNPPALAVPEQDRVGLIAGHMWLLFKLACFVYFFAGGGGWYRPLMLGIIAGIVYLAQIGIFDTQFAVVRRHFEALLPLAERAVQPPNLANANAPNGRVEPGRNLSPQDAAQRLVQQRQDQRVGWIRETMRSTERAFAIFVASLWPGIGERMVHAQEERERAERAAEEERQRQREGEEEARRQEDERKQNEKADGADTAHGPTQTSSADAAADTRVAVGTDEGSLEGQPGASAKGKEKAVGSVEGSD
jgi:hypothetical protein